MAEESEANVDDEMRDVLEDLRDRDPAWIDFALVKSDRIAEALDSCEGIDSRDELGIRLFLMTCLSDYYFVSRHYGIVDKPCSFAAELPLGGSEDWFRYTEGETGAIGEIISEPLSEMAGRDSPEDDIPRAAVVIEGLEDGEGPEFRGFLIPNGRDEAASEVIQIFYPEHEEGFRCDRMGSTAVMSWGLDGLSSILEQPNVRMWDVSFGTSEPALD